MSDFFEIDFLDVESTKSGDAIALHYQAGDAYRIHVVDGGYAATGEALTQHIETYYQNPRAIDHVVVTHPDGDHAAGLQTILENYEVRELWMIRPWLYASILIDRFRNYSSVENLKERLKESYPNLATLEKMANEKNITISEPFQGKQIGAFTVLSPTRNRYLDLVVDSELTPEAKRASTTALSDLGAFTKEAATKAVRLLQRFRETLNQ